MIQIIRGVSLFKVRAKLQSRRQNWRKLTTFQKRLLHLLLLVGCMPFSRNLPASNFWHSTQHKFHIIIQLCLSSDFCTSQGVGGWTNSNSSFIIWCVPLFPSGKVSSFFQVIQPHGKVFRDFQGFLILQTLLSLPHNFLVLLVRLSPC